MRFFRFMVIGFVLLVLVSGILGTACAGAKGEQGPQGETGATGATGPAGPAGAAGAQGLQGVVGIQGIQGIQGPPGLPGAGVAWQGEWSNATTYSQDDAVGYQGSSYISKQDANTNHLPTDTAWWNLWVAKGDTGATGATGETGAAGADGAQGLQGEPGPNMIVAMGNIAADATINQGYNVTNCSYNAEFYTYYISLTGITYSSTSYVTLVTPTLSSARHAIYWNAGGILGVTLYDGAGSYVQGGFSFMVLDATP